MNQLEIKKDKIGERTRLIRKHFSLKQAKMAINLGLKTSSYGRIELGLVGMSLSVLNILIEKYSVNINWLLTGKGEMFITNTFTNNELKEANSKLLEENSNLKSEIITLLKQNQSIKKPILVH